MKKLRFIAIMFALIFLLAACGSTEEASKSSGSEEEKQKKRKKSRLPINTEKLPLKRTRRK